MSSVWYIGSADSREISGVSWAAAGIPGKTDSVWDQTNGWSIPTSSFTTSQLDILALMGDFDTEAPDSPRSDLYVATDDSATKAYVNAAILVATQTEVSRADSAYVSATSLNNAIDNEVMRADEAYTTEDELIAAILSETTRADAAYEPTGAVNTAIQGEITRANAAYEHAGAVSTAMSAEVARADAAYDAKGAAASAQGAAQAFATTAVNNSAVVVTAAYQNYADTSASNARGAAVSTAATYTDTQVNVEKARAQSVEALKADLVGGVIPTAQLPALAISDVFTPANQAAMLALSAQRGDVAVRADIGKTFILSADTPSVLSAWKEMSAVGVVQSVNNQTGAITLSAANVGADAAGAAATAQTAAQAYTDTKISAEVTRANAAYDATGAAAGAQATAEVYTDTKISAEVTRANVAYDASGAAATAKTQALAYTDSSMTSEVTRANAAYDAAGSANTSLTASKSYADQLIANEVSRANEAYDALGAAASAAASAQASAVATAEAYTDSGLSGKIDNSDVRLTDSRTPLAHASTHASAGTDPITIDESQVNGLTADLTARPLDSAVVHSGAVNETVAGQKTFNGITTVSNRLFMTGALRLDATTIQTATVTASMTGPPTYLCDATTAAFTVNLPKQANQAGTIMYIKKIDSTTHTVTVNAQTGGTIDAAQTFVLSAQYKYVIIMAGATSGVWYLLGSN